MSGLNDQQGLAHTCPECGAQPGKRCREVSGEWMTEKYGRPRRYRQVKPHSRRAALGLRDVLDEDAGDS